MSENKRLLWGFLLAWPTQYIKELASHHLVSCNANHIQQLICNTMTQS